MYLFLIRYVQLVSNGGLVDNIIIDYVIMLCSHSNEGGQQKISDLKM